MTFNIKYEELLHSLNKKSGREFNTISVLLRNGFVEQSLCSQGQNFFCYSRNFVHFMEQKNLLPYS